MNAYGNVYISGSTTGNLDGPNAGLNDAFISKFDSDGELQWTRQQGTEHFDPSTGVAADGMGNVYITGFMNSGIRSDPDAFVTKFDAEGNRAWTKQLGTEEEDVSSAVAVDHSGNIYIAGRTSGDLDAEVNAGMSDGFLSRYDENGTLVWTRLLGSDTYDELEGVTVDELGNVLVAGRTRGLIGQQSAGSYDILLATYDSSGLLKWTRQLGTPALDGSLGISADGAGSIYISGYTEGSLAGTNLGFDDIIVAKYSTIPEPSAVALLVLGSLMFALRRRGRDLK